MTKARTKGQKKRGRPKMENIPRQPNGQPSRMKKSDIEANMSVAMRARAQHAPKGTPIDALKLPWMGCNAGRSIACEPDASDLWQDILTIRQRRRAWLSVIGQDEFAGISSIKPASDFSGDEAPPADFRTAEEKARAAETAWDLIVDALRVVDPLLLRYVERAVVLDEPIPGPLAQVLRMKGLQKALGK